MGGGLTVSNPSGSTLMVEATTLHARAIRLLVYSAALHPIYSLHAESKGWEEKRSPITESHLARKKKKIARGRLRNAIVYKITL